MPVLCLEGQKGQQKFCSYSLLSTTAQDPPADSESPCSGFLNLKNALHRAPLAAARRSRTPARHRLHSRCTGAPSRPGMAIVSGCGTQDAARGCVKAPLTIIKTIV